MLVVRKLACGIMCFATMIASATVTTNLDSYVEYIQSSGTQWIDTGVIGKSTVNIAADVMVLSSAGSSCFIGERPGTDVNKGRDLRLGIWINNSYKWALNCGAIDSGWIGSISYQDSRCVVSNENGRLWVAVNGGTPTKIHDGADQTFTSSLTLTMFFLNTSSGLDQASNRALSARVYGLTLHDSGTLVRDFHPCRVTITDTDAGTSVSKNGLWDEVDDCFYGDLSGGTDFTAGADVVAARLVILPIPDQINETFGTSCPECVVSNMSDNSFWTVGGAIASPLFDVEYADNDGTGVAKVTVTGKDGGAFAGKHAVQTFNIVATKYEDENFATTDLTARRHLVDGKSVYVFNGTASSQTITAKRDINLIDYLVVGGGGGGGHTMAGGGGAGGVTNATGLVGINVSRGETFTVVVGAGGIGSRSQTDRGGKGGTSSLQFGLLSVAVPGGGGGGSWSSAYVNVKQGGAGACGGGGCQDGAGGAGIDGFGFAGAAGTGTNTSKSGGGGGAGHAGYAADTTAQHAGYGGEGVSNNITGVWVVYGGGGGGGGSSYGYNQYTAGLGGLGGGGDGGRAVDGYPGVDGLGGGGGGGGRDSGGNKIGGAGGSGTVIFAIKAADFEVDPIPDQYLADGGCEPLPVVRDGATILVKDTDYTVAYANNTQAGAATLTITGIGTYDGKSATVGFKIISRYFAKPSVSSGGDGLSWATAMSVAEAFAAVAAGTGFREIWIQSGTVSQPEISIVNSGALVVRGGFAGTEVALSDRQPGGLTIFDGERAVNILLTIDNETVDNVVLDRLKLCRAKFNGLVKTGKGGLQAYDCVIEGNGLDAKKGNNVWGRGMKLESDGYGSLVISNCVVAGNRNAYDDSQQGGFGLYISKFNDARIDNSLFVTNGYNIANAASAYCGMYSRGSAILAIDTPIFVRGSRFAGNCCPVRKSVTSSDGSGGVIALIGAGDGSRFENCAFVGNTECLSMGVSGVVNTGGALAICLNNSSAKATVSNCTFAYNISQGGASAGGITVAGGNVDIANSIFWKNARYNYTTSGYGTDVQVSSGSASISHSLVTTLDGTALFGANLTVDTDTVFAIDPLLVTSTAAYEALLTVTDSAMYYNTGNANRYADLASMDVHLLSPAGYVVNGGAFGPATNACSSAIDAGDPDADYANEPSPNGDRLNLGAYGNTAEASRTATGQPEATVAVVFPGGEARPMAQVTMGLESGSGYMATVHVLCSINGVTLAEETFYKVANGDVLELKSPSYLPQGTKFDVAVTITASGAESKHYETSEPVSGTYPAYYGKGGGANVIHVRTGADGYMDGSNWEHAYPDLRAAFAAAPDASKTEVWLSVTNDYLDAAMTLDHSLTFRGGFTGAEDEPSERPEGLRSLLWGNNYYKTMQIAVPSGMLLTVDRVHFTHSGDSELKKTGAGDLIVRDCVFADSRQDSGDIYGRGIYASGGTVSVTNCQFRNLTCPNGSQPGSGIYLTSCVQAYVDDCLFVTNGTGFSYNSPGWSGHRAAAAFVNATPTIFRNCRFAACCAALYDSNASGGIVSFAGASGGSKLINCAFVGNSDFESLNCPLSYSGGAISCVMSDQDQALDIENCTVAYNLTLGTRSSAGITVHTGTVNLKNSIVYGNVLGKIGNLAAGADIEVKANGTLNMSYTLVTGLESNYVNAVEGATTNIGVGVICVDPLLATTTNDFHSLFSPNPNAGNNPTYWYLTQANRAACAALDVHPRTYTGYMLNGVLIKDPEKVESPTIDAGDPNSDRSKEPTIPGVGYPGKSVNLGAYGNTPEAAMTRLPGFYLLLR